MCLNLIVYKFSAYCYGERNKKPVAYKRASMAVVLASFQGNLLQNGT